MSVLQQSTSRQSDWFWLQARKKRATPTIKQPINFFSAVDLTATQHKIFGFQAQHPPSANRNSSQLKIKTNGKKRMYEFRLNFVWMPLPPDVQTVLHEMCTRSASTRHKTYSLCFSMRFFFFSVLSLQFQKGNRCSGTSTGLTGCGFISLTLL